MDQSLSITLMFEGGLPSLYLSVQDTYSSPAQIFSAPLEFVDTHLLVNSAQATGDYWMVTASPDNMRFQVESAIFVRHRDGKIYWDLVFEHYEPFLNVELEDEVDDYEENIITFTFDPFQYTSALYQASQLCRQIAPVTFNLPEDKEEDEVANKEATEENAASLHPMFSLGQHLPRLNLLWQKYGQTQNWVENGSPTRTSDYFLEETERQWLQDMLSTLDEMHQEHIKENFDAYLESLPEEVQAKLETDGQLLGSILTQRWNALVNSLTQEEADALENDQSASRFPDSLKLRLMREFLEGNPTVLLGHGNNSSPPSEKVVDLQNWKRNRPAVGNSSKPADKPTDPPPNPRPPSRPRPSAA